MFKLVDVSVPYNLQGGRSVELTWSTNPIQGYTALGVVGVATNWGDVNISLAMVYDRNGINGRFQIRNNSGTTVNTTATLRILLAKNELLSL